MASQIALISGIGFAGFTIPITSYDILFLGISVCGMISTILIVYILPNLTFETSSSNGWKRETLSMGPALYLKYPVLFSVACCSALVFSIGQVTNTLLPALINIDLKQTSVSYSMIEVAWSIGAFCVSALMASKIRHSKGQISHDLLLIAIMATLLGIAPNLASFEALLFVHILLGIGFSFVRIRSETRFFEICPTPLLGRFRANSLFLTNLIGLLIFATPTMYRDLSVQSLYLLLSATILVSALAIWLFLRMSGADMVANT